ncbi:hypothetical protein ACFO1B_16945 [Dactylosporangium siamense]|uniref:Uncharacterized protein n=1 Tax=Dactylosporangium siamense TaxID=685454 RepID=A0A919PNA8_9ACTN|nr:hypothetical protein [Dactylosporangium siamense]GIG45530.1 hypothetical protein Dsi01nite_035710 [Dactylosporangium siamense]
MPALIEPDAHLHRAWLDAHAEWGPGLHEDGFGIATTDDVITPAGFATWVARLAREAAPSPGRHGCTYRSIVEDVQVP